MRVVVSARRVVPLLLAIAALFPAAVYGQAAAEPAAATLTVASMFSDHMVLQRDMEIPVWGKAGPGAKVTVTLGDESAEATAGDDGRWKVSLPAMAAGGPHEVAVTAGGETTKFADVLIGDVWVASGQSNMEWPVSASDEAEREIADADWPEIRLIDVPNEVDEKPRDSFKTDGWQAVSPQSIGGFSAVAYFFARDLHEKLDVPIGLVGCNWGGTRMEAWTSHDALLASETFAAMVKADDAPPANDEEAKFRREAPQHRPASLFNGMTAAVIPYGIRGVIWYQGESNAGEHAQYAELSKLMITDWRTRWGQGDFPFLLVQLAAWEPGGDNWPLLREAQTDTLELNNVGMATAIDIGHPTDIHPRNKQEVGRRLALAALAIAHGEDVIYSGPTFHDLTVEDGRVRVAFDHVAGGLKVELKGFEVAGADGKFVPAHAVLQGDHVFVHSDAVAEPKQVRYNWKSYTEGNLQNSDGLPAVPFRSQR